MPICRHRWGDPTHVLSGVTMVIRELRLAATSFVATALAIVVTHVLLK